MTLLRALVSRFSALLGDVYYEGTVPPDAPYPYAVVSAKIPAAFGGTGEITLCCYERGGDSHTRIAEKMARVMRFSGSLVHYGGGLALLQSPQCAIGHEKGGVTVLRAGYNMERYTPPFVAPRRVLTLDELRKRGFGEALYSQLTPEQRQQTLILRDADELGELITNREEAMAAETMLTNGCVMKHIADDVDKADEMEIRFYSEASNPATYTPTAKWDATGGKILKDLEAMIRMLTKRGLRASDLVCSPDVADTIINDAAVQKLLDNRRIEIGNVEPELLPDGAGIVARLNVLGRIISVISYDLTYTDDEGKDKLYIPSGKCVLTAPGAGRTAYGAVSQVEQSDGEFHTYAGRRVPKYVSSAEGNSRTLTISSRPLMIPNNKNPFIVADVLTD